MMIFKRITALLLILCLGLPCAAIAEEEEEDWSLEDLAPVTEEPLPDFEAEDFDWDAWISSADAEDTVSALEDDWEVDAAANPSDLELNPNLPGNVINIMLIGIDSHVKDIREEKASHLNDSNMILSINTDDGSIKLTSILRDLYVTIPGSKNKAKFNNAYYRGGGDLVMRTVNHNFGMNIQYYVAINFFGVASIIDALGGIDIDMTKTEAAAINAYLSNAYKKKSKFTYDTKDSSERIPLEKITGVQHCDGIQALMYARLRKIDNDFKRSARQRHLLELLLNKVLQDLDMNKLLNLITTCLPYTITNMNAQSIMNLAFTVLKTDIISRAHEDVSELFTQHRIPMDHTYSYVTTSGGSSAIGLSNKQWDTNVQSLHYFIYNNYYPAN